MKKIKAALGYRILMLLATIDHHYEVSEGALMIRFVDKMTKNGIDIEKQNSYLLNQSPTELLNRFVKWLTLFSRIANPQERADLMYYAFEIANHPQHNNDLERKMLMKTGQLLDISAVPLLSEMVI
jgi:hypothetical protein